MKTIDELLEHYAGIAYHKQMDFSDVVAGINRWNIDITKEEIAFGPDLSFKIQIIGTLAYADNSWLWAWANTQSAFPENIIRQSLELKKYGEENDISILNTPVTPLPKEALYFIGMVASPPANNSIN